MERTKQEFYVGDEVHIREEVDKMPYGYMPEMKKLRGRNAIITKAYYEHDVHDWVYRIDIGLGYNWHAKCFSRLTPELPEFEGGTVSDFLNMF